MTAPTWPLIPAPTPTGRAFTIPLPPGLRLLNANQRLHHHRRAEYTAALRGAATAACRENPELRAALTATRPVLQHAHIIGVLHPARRGRRDAANWYPSFKAAVDGIVDARVLDDDDHTRVIGPDMRIGHPVKDSQLVLHVYEVAGGWTLPGQGVAQ